MMEYTDSQSEAIGCLDQNLQIIAGAGSGKTQVIAARAVEILHETDADPENIVAFTFTEKAAAELKARIMKIAERRLGDVPGLAEMYVGTIHGFCLDFLQTYLYKFLKYSVLDEVQTRLLISRNSRKSGLTNVQLLNRDDETLSRSKYDVDVFVNALNVIREDSVELDKVPDSLQAALEKYHALLDEHRYLDFSRLQLEAVEALNSNDSEHREAQKKLGERIDYLIVDEYQDVNPLQEDLIKRIHDLGANVCVVGDDDQTIYQWRGSDVQNIVEFDQRYPDVRQVELGINFRSSEAIVHTGNSIAKLNPDRLSKTLQSAKITSDVDRGDILALDFENPAEEAEWIADKIKELRGTRYKDSPHAEPRGLDWSDFAILLRSVKGNGEPIVEAFREADIPFVVGGMNNLFDRPEIGAAEALFKYVAGKVNASYVKAEWKEANLGLSDEELERGIDVLEDATDRDEGERWSAYNLQRVFLDFLEAIELREETVPDTPSMNERGEIVFYNLGKFSQLISDFEEIHFQSKPERKYKTFVGWLEHEAPDYYEEGSDEAGYAEPNAVRVMTIHQAKGKEWPGVFVPALIRNRFPSSGGGGRSKWHILPKKHVPNAERYDGPVEDERRLFYVAITRAEKYLFGSYAPVPDNQLYQKSSEFFEALVGSPYSLSKDPGHDHLDTLPPEQKSDEEQVVLSFSELKYYFECPYHFKLRFLYGFNPPLHEALGYGKSLHDALAEVHQRALDGDIVERDEIDELIDRHLYTPYAYPELEEDLRDAAEKGVERYLDEHGDTLEQTEFVEHKVELQLDSGVTVQGRVDLIRRRDTDEVSIVDFKSTHRAQEEDVTWKQLKTYALGYEELTGEHPDQVEIVNLDDSGEGGTEPLSEAILQRTAEKLQEAGESVKEDKFSRLEDWGSTCEQCDLVGICRDAAE